MRLTYLKFTLAIILIIALGLFCLPLFQFQINGQTLYWPALDLSALGISSPLANFRRGEDLYPQKRLTFSIVIPEGFNPEEGVNKFIDDQIMIVRRRLDASGIIDVRIVSTKATGKYEISFIAPDYYANDQLASLARILTSKGELEFIEHTPTGEGSLLLEDSAQQLLSAIAPSYLPRASDLILNDLTGITIEPRNSLDQEFLRLRFNETASGKLAAAILNGKYRDTTLSDDQKFPILVLLDGSPSFLLIDVNHSTELLARAIFGATNLDIRAYAALFITQSELSVTFSDNGFSVEEQIYAQEGRTVLAITFIMSAAALAVLALSRLGKRGTLSFVLMFAGYVTMSVAAFKVAAAAISIGLVVGFAVAFALAAAFILDMIRHVKQEPRQSHYRGLGMFVFVLLAVVYQSAITFGAYQTFIGTIALLFFVLFVAEMLIFKPILDWYHQA